MSHDKPSVRIALTLSACALLAATASAETGPDRERRGQRWDANPAEILERLDKNGDGVVTPEDVPEGARGERLLKRLERLDGDADGQVTLAELEQGRTRALERADRRGGRGHAKKGRLHRFESRDLDGDGRLSPDEFQGKAARFERLDSDGDGVITRDQLGEGERGERAARLFDRLDADHDGRLTSAEIAASRAERFERLDFDGDGFLSKEELSTKRKQRGTGREL